MTQRSLVLKGLKVGKRHLLMRPFHKGGVMEA